METLFFYLLIDILAIFLIKIGVGKNRNSITKKGTLKKGSIIIFLSALILFIPIAFRSLDVGVDTKGYYDVFMRLIKGYATKSDLAWLGLGYRFIIKFIGLFSHSHVLLNSIVGGFSLYFLYKAFLENSKNPALSLFIFISTTLYYQMFNQARQLFAITIILYSFKYLKSRNFKKYLFFILFAASIHESAIIMLPVYFVSNFDIKKKNLFIYFLLVLAVYFGFEYFEKILLYTKYGKIYAGTNYYVTSSSSIINLAFRSLLMTYLLFMSNKMAIKNDESKMLINMSIFCVLLQTLTIKLYIISRMTTYFYVFFTISLPNSIESMENNYNKKIMTLLLVVMFIFYHFIYYKFMADASGIADYSFIFSNN